MRFLSDVLFAVVSSLFRITVESKKKNNLEKGKLVRVIGRFEKSGLKLQCLPTGEEKLGLV